MKHEVFYLRDNETGKLTNKPYRTWQHADAARQRLIEPVLAFREVYKEEGTKRFSILRLAGELEEV